MPCWEGQDGRGRQPDGLCRLPRGYFYARQGCLCLSHLLWAETLEPDPPAPEVAARPASVAEIEPVISLTDAAAAAEASSTSARSALRAAEASVAERLIERRSLELAASQAHAACAEP